ncbi:MAG: pyrroline-5-carboxylate reductase, partial [Actinobacteria bacterium]
MSDTAMFEGTLAVIGGGKMGEAIIGGLVSSAALSSAQIAVAEPSAERREDLAERFGVRVSADGRDVVPGAAAVLLAVKPQVMDGVVSSLADLVGGAIVVSIAAGITTARLESLLPAGTAVVRVMPNTPALVGSGVALVSGGSDASAEQVELVRALFGAIGTALVLEEKLQDAGTAISGSGPAYFALVVDALARAGVAQG